jgi:hypothetical protein
VLFNFVIYLSGAKQGNKEHNILFGIIYHVTVNILALKKSGLMLRQISHRMPIVKGRIKGGRNTETNKSPGCKELTI